MAEPRSRTTLLQRVLGGPRVLGRRISGPRGLADLVREGLPHESFARVGDRLAVAPATLAKVLGIPARTLARRVGGQLKPDESDRLLRVAKVLARAIEVLGDEARGAGWMTAPQLALGEETPLSLLDTEIGEDEVLQLLGRIEHGVVA